MDEVAGFALCIFATRFSFWLCRFSLSQLIATKNGVGRFALCVFATENWFFHFDSADFLLVNWLLQKNGVGRFALCIFVAMKNRVLDFDSADLFFWFRLQKRSYCARSRQIFPLHFLRWKMDFLNST
jgi:hypothetical protein